jgi:hypothetical protein
MSDWWQADPVTPLPGQPGQPRIEVRPRSPDFWAADPVAGKASASDIALDVAKSGGVGLGRGAIGLAGFVGDMSDLGATGMEKVEELANKYIGDQLGFPRIQRGDRSQSVLNNIPTSRSITKAVEENVTGEFYKPQTTAGEYARTVGEFIPGALAGPGGMVRNTLAFGVVPGLASEAAGQATKGTAVEPYARAGAALVTGGVAGVASAPGNVAGSVSRAAGGVDRAMLQQAEALFQEAQRMGMPLTRAEAIQAVTGGATNFGNLQRVVEGQGGLRDFFAQRAGMNDAAAGRAFDTVTPAAPNPSAIGPAVGTAAEGTVNDVRGVINRASEPFYTQASTIRLTPQEMAQVRALPGFREARHAVRNDPQLNRHVANLPDDSVGFLNEVKKYLDTAAETASAPVNAQRNMQRSAGYGTDATSVRDAAVNASRRTPANPYETALDIQSRAREQYLQPLLDGPVGKIAAKDTTTQKAIDVLFPKSPLPNSQQEIGQAVAAVAQRNAYAARNLVRAHLEMTFNEATQNLASGDNSYGGAKFAAVVRGNPQQAANLEAAVRALPNGDQVWPGVDRFLTVLEAQGQRQAIGSQTAFNQEVLQDLRQGRLAAEAGSAALSAGLKLPTKIKDRIERWRMGRNVDDLARLFTDPTAGREFARLARAGSGINSAGSIIRLVGLAERGAEQPGSRPSEVPVNNRAPRPQN